MAKAGSPEIDASLFSELEVLATALARQKRREKVLHDPHYTMLEIKATLAIEGGRKRYQTDQSRYVSKTGDP